ncbi:MAG: restriction endonuclease subunit S [Novipirellula sp. JB048]
MSFPAYDEYKDSGVDWFDEVPGHLSMPPLYARYQQVLGKMLDQNKLTGKHPMPYVRNVDVQWDKVNTEDLPIIDIEPSERARFTVNKGDLLICEGGEVGRSAIWKGECGNVGFQKAIHRLRPLDRTEDVRFCYYLMRFATAMQVFLAGANPNTIPHLTGEQLRGYRLPKPPLDEQRAIASFLDVETSKIDALVSEQRRLIELLKEKRQAVISHAVTKGLNPDAPMKPSGIGWLGEVPQHWETKAFQRCVYVAEGQVDPKSDDYSDMILIAPNHIESGTGRLHDLETADDQGAISGKYLCKAGDVIYSKIRPALRKVCIAPEDCLCSADMYPLQAHSGLTNEFLFRWILSEQFSAFAVLESDRVAMPKINRESLKKVRFALPPIEEQKEICEHITRQTEGFDTLQAEAERAIELLGERRTALISAAVTGKIDVREFACQETV